MEKRKEAFQKQHDKMEQVAVRRVELFAQLEKAEKRVRTATVATIDGELEAFKALKKELTQVTAELPRTEKRKGYFKDIEELNEQVESRVEEVAQSLKAMEEHVQARVEIIEEEVEQFVEEGGSLLQVFLLTASEEVKDAFKELMHNKKVLALLRDNQELLSLMGTENVAEGLQQLTDGNEGSIALPPKNQIAVLETVLDVLTRNTDVKSESVVLACQLLGTVVKGVRDLQKGDKQYVTFVTEVGGFAKVIHLSFNDFLHDPLAIGNFYSTLLKQGITNKLHMVFTSPEQAATIFFAVNNVDVRALTQRMASLSQEELLGLTQGNMGGALVSSSNGALVQGLPKVEKFSDVITLIAHSTGNVTYCAYFIMNIFIPEPINSDMTHSRQKLRKKYK